MGLDPGDGGVLGGRQNAGAVLDGDDAIDHRVGGAARHHGADVALGRAIDVEDQKFVVLGVGDRDRCAGEIGRIRQVLDDLAREGAVVGDLAQIETRGDIDARPSHGRNGCPWRQW